MLHVAVRLEDFILYNSPGISCRTHFPKPEYADSTIKYRTAQSAFPRAYRTLSLNTSERISLHHPAVAVARSPVPEHPRISVGAASEAQVPQLDTVAAREGDIRGGHSVDHRQRHCSLCLVGR